MSEKRITKNTEIPLIALAGCQESPRTKHLAVNSTVSELVIDPATSGRRELLMIRNIGTTTLYIGGPDVATADNADVAGVPLLAKEFLSFEFDGDRLISIYAISDADGGAVSICEV